MNTPGNDRMHELLCAYLLDEVDANERAQVAEALAASSELRAERDRLEQTLGLVTSAYQGEEALSESAFASVLDQAEASARPARPRFVLLRPAMMRAAAAVLVVVTGTWAWIQRGEVSTGDEQVAVAFRASSPSRADGEMAQDEQRLEQEGARRKNKPAEMLRDIGYANADGPQAEAPSGLGYLGEQDMDVVAGKESQVFEEVAETEADPKAYLDELLDDKAFNKTIAIGGVAGAKSDVRLEDAERSALKGMGYVSSEPTVVKVQEPVSPAVPGRQSTPIGVGEGKAGALGAGLGKKREQVRQKQLSRDQQQQLQALGYADASGGSAAEMPQANAPQPTGAHRGPGDSVARNRNALASGVPSAPTGGTAEQRKDRGEAVAALDRDGRAGGSDTFYIGGGDRAKPSPVEREAQLREWRERVIHDCYPRPNDLPRDMYFRFWGDNSFELTELDSQSTFSADVDTASYALARRYLAEGNIPTKAQIRTEEFLNAFDPDVPAPSEGTFAIETELAPSRFSGDRSRSMLRVGIRGREVSKSERKPLSITFVIDTSGSMRENDRLELVKHAVRLLVGELNQDDSIAIVSYSNNARIVLPLTSADRGGEIEAAIYPLQPGGSTNAEAGLMLGYQVAQAGLDPTRNHRVVFLSDGVANVGQTDQDRLAQSVRQNVDAGIYLNTIGVGMNNHNDVFLEQLADKGDGVCDYIDSPKAAKRAIVERFTGAFETIASDVKIQVEFDPKQVHRYRLLGYENRAVADKDFRNDAVDAGEVGAGHQVVALYELEMVPDGSGEGPFATVRLRYKEPLVAGQDPRESDVTEIEAQVAAGDAKQSYAAASPGYRRSVVVAQFAEFLRRSTHARGDAFEELLSETAQLARELATPEFDEFLGMVKKAYQLGPPADLRGDLELTLDEFRRFQILRKELESLNREVDGALLKDLKDRNIELEEQLRDLIKREIDKQG